MRPLSLLFLLVVVLSASVAQAEVKGAAYKLQSGTPHSIEVLGWSSDESHVALRHVAYEDEDQEMMDEVEPCAGYVDHKGAVFRGTLSILVFKGAKLVKAVAVQDGTGEGGKTTENGCTPPKVAKARLASAKAAMTKFKIDVEKRGRTAAGKAFTVKPPGAKAAQKLRLNEWMKQSVDDDEMTNIYNGTFALRHNEKVLQRLKVKDAFIPTMAAGLDLSVGPIFVSPSERTLVLFVNEDFTSGRGNSTRPYLFGVYQWANGSFSKR